jgi:hypothetical protein
MASPEKSHEEAPPLSRAEQRSAETQDALATLLTKQFNKGNLTEPRVAEFLKADPEQALLVLTEVNQQMANGLIDASDFLAVRNTMPIAEADRWLQANVLRIDYLLKLDDLGVPKIGPFRNKVESAYKIKDAVESATELENLIRKWKKRQRKKDKRHAAALIKQLDSDSLIS